MEKKASVSIKFYFHFHFYFLSQCILYVRPIVYSKVPQLRSLHNYTDMYAKNTTCFRSQLAKLMPFWFRFKD